MGWDGMGRYGWMVFFYRVELGRRFYFNISISSIFLSVLAFFPPLLSSFLPSLYFFLLPSFLPSFLSFFLPFFLPIFLPYLLLTFPPFLLPPSFPTSFFPLSVFSPSSSLSFPPSYSRYVRYPSIITYTRYSGQHCSAPWCMWYNVMVMGWSKMDSGRLGGNDRSLLITELAFCLVVSRLVGCVDGGGNGRVLVGGL